MSLTRVLLVLVTLVTVLSPVDAEAARHLGMRWDHREVIVVENRAGRHWNAAVNHVVREWRRLFPRLRFTIKHRPKVGCGERVTEGRIVICQMPYSESVGGASWAEHDRHRITNAFINVVHDPPSEQWGTWNRHLSRSSVQALCHEFGHALGLEHYQFDTGSCLGAVSWTDPADIRVTPSQYDREGLLALYAERGRGWP